MQKMKKVYKNAGITLIALVITIIVMLILAGVSLNATIGENGIMAQAKNATYMQGIASLEEYLNQFYVENYEDLKNSEDKAEALSNYSKSSNWFYKTANGYVVDKNGKINYFLKVENLPEEAKKEIVDGKSEGKTYGDYINGIDVYGVTKDLQVYYLKDGFENVLGASYENQKDEDPTKVVFEAGSLWSKVVSGEEARALTIKDMKDTTTLNIDDNSGITSFTDIYNFTSLKKLTLTNINMSSLAGLDNVRDLEYLYLKNVNIGDYSAISKLTKLKYLYVERNGNTEEADNVQVGKMLDAMAGVDYTKLEYFGIFGHSQLDYFYGEGRNIYESSQKSSLSNISKFNNLSISTKNTIKYLYLNNNNIADFSPIEQCNNVSILRIETNNAENLNFIKNMKDILYLIAANNKLNDISILDNSFTKIQILNLRENVQLSNCSELQKLTTLNGLYMSGCTNLSIVDVEEIADFYNLIKYKNINGKYAEYLQGSTQRIYSNKNLADNSEQILALMNMSDANKLKVKKIDLSSNKNLTDECLNKLLNLGFKNLVYLNLNNCSQLSKLDFLEKTPNIVELRLANTNILGNEVEKLDKYCSRIGIIQLNTDIDLTKMQKTISNLSINTKELGEDCGFISTIYPRLYISENLVKQLEKCTEITYIRPDGVPIINETIDLSNCTKLKNVTLYNGNKYKLPKSVVQLGVSNKLPDVSECVNTIQSIYGNGLGSITTEDWNEFFRTLSTSTSLQAVTLNIGTNIGLEPIKYLSKSNVETLIFKRNEAYFGSLENLKNIDFRKSEDYTEGTSHFENLKYISMEYTGYTALENFKDCKNLTTLRIINSKITDISAVSNLTNLTTLNLNNNSISNLNGLQNLNNLTSLNLNNNSIYNTIYDASLGANVNNIEIIKNLNSKKLKEIHLLNNKIDDYTELNKLSFNKKEW